MRKNFTRLLALVLVAVFVLGLIPTAFADQEERTSDRVCSVTVRDVHLSADAPTEPAVEEQEEGLSRKELGIYCFIAACVLFVAPMLKKRGF